MVARASLRGPGLGDQGLTDAVGERHVFLDEQRRHREHVADRVEAVAGVVARKVFGDIGIEPHEVADGVGVFGTVEPSQHHTAGIRPGGIETEDVSLHEADQLRAVVGRRSGLVGRGHRLGAEISQDRHPCRLIGTAGRGGPIRQPIEQPVDRQAPLFRAVEVAGSAVRAEQFAASGGTPIGGRRPPGVVNEARGVGADRRLGRGGRQSAWRRHVGHQRDDHDHAGCHGGPVPHVAAGPCPGSSSHGRIVQRAAAAPHRRCRFFTCTTNGADDSR